MTNVIIEYNTSNLNKQVHKIGNWYKLQDGNEDVFAVLTQINGNIFLICADGDYWESSPVMVGKRSITEEDFKVLCGEDTEYTLLKNITIAVE